MGNATSSSLLRCCIPARNLPGSEDEQDAFTERGLATNKVELACSELFSVPGIATAYHTSVLVNGEEFFFSDSGIFSDRALTSHQGKPSERVELGYSRRTGTQLLRALQPHFRPGTYDLVRKNCNSFSDCALHYLMRRRLDGKYSALERVGQRVSLDMLNRFTKGMYQPNQAASDFTTDDVIAALDKLGDQEPPPAGGGMSHARAALTLGASVTVVGLKNADQLNGQGAQIMRYNGVNGRWEARVNSSGEIKAFRAENLRPAGELVLETGDAVRIHGLKSESGQALNGQEGHVLRYLHDVSRYEVQLGEGTKALKAENLQATGDVSAR
mmetsp:Transcript_71676/g.184852  ORF Transcript_71676/g.184852 Transcript_71676/m.184852 type:complete len:328 (+) Transcript_71676:166-1149(+)